ncbi:TetR/AcrR family transcriptional regulator [Pseudomonas sp. zfem002]|uniref:TetR/AcrR family transcriptional regulator n=1 Tax=Pseudomonas sp. zfem002 TaxID=3078197 RepID=UPI0029286591|nr:TetR/AcrR family transcriptional regulator [Pseudomonas sp. zfem002]MDU9390226.1 TetR/AcrR family transcriptional regulator [Pseudomonas sp. zfem002]
MDTLTSSTEHGGSLPGKLLNALYAAVAQRPRASMQELAALAGVSRATLHRHCGTRENLDSQLDRHARAALLQMLGTVDALASQPLLAVRQLIHEHLARDALIAFLASRYHAQAQAQREEELSFYVQRLDTLFLNGQRQGAFRLDVTAAVLTEIFVSLLYGTVGARQRGRTPGQCARMLENAFLQGLARRPLE